MNTLQSIGAFLGEKITRLYNKQQQHTGDTANPHRVTKAQVGLGNADNTADTDKPLSAAQAAAIAAHNAGDASHPDLRNAIGNLLGGSTPVSQSEYAGKLGDALSSYTKPQLDTILNRLVRQLALNADNYILTVTYQDGTTRQIDFPIEATVKDGHYDADTNELVLVLVSGQEIRIPAAGINKMYIGKDSPTTSVAITSAGEISADIKQNAIAKVHLTEQLRDEIAGHQTTTGDTGDNIATFADQPARVNIASGDKLSVMFGKIKRWFADLGDLAFKNLVSKSDLNPDLQNEINGKEPAFTKNTAFNRNFGTSAGTICEGNDARLSDTRLANGGNADTVGGLDNNNFFKKLNNNIVDEFGCTTTIIDPTALGAYPYGTHLKFLTHGSAHMSLYAPERRNNTPELYIESGWNGEKSVWTRLAVADEIPTNHVTTDTNQTITGAKTFNSYITCVGGAGLASSSDIRFKNNIAPLADMLPLVVGAPGLIYNWKEEESISIGTSAQYWEDKVPPLVRELNDDDKTKTFSYERYTVILQEAIKELYTKISDLEREVSLLKSTDKGKLNN